MGSRPTTVGLAPDPGAGTWWMSPVSRSLTRAEPSGSGAIDHAISSPRRSVRAGPDSRAGEVPLALVSLGAVASGAVLVVVDVAAVGADVGAAPSSSAGAPVQAARARSGAGRPTRS